MKAMNGFPLGGRTLKVGPASTNGPNLSNMNQTNAEDKEDLSISGNERFLIMQKLARGTGGNNCKTISLKNMVTKEELYDEDLEEEITSECLNFGIVDKLVLYQVPGSSEVIVYVVFDSPSSAEKAVSALNQRWFAKRLIIAEFSSLPVLNE